MLRRRGLDHVRHGERSCPEVPVAAAGCAQLQLQRQLQPEPQPELQPQLQLQLQAECAGAIAGGAPALHLVTAVRLDQRGRAARARLDLVGSEVLPRRLLLRRKRRRALPALPAGPARSSSRGGRRRAGLARVERRGAADQAAGDLAQRAVERGRPVLRPSPAGDVGAVRGAADVEGRVQCRGLLEPAAAHRHTNPR